MFRKVPSTVLCCGLPIMKQLFHDWVVAAACLISISFCQKKIQLSFCFCVEQGKNLEANFCPIHQDRVMARHSQYVYRIRVDEQYSTDQKAGSSNLPRSAIPFSSPYVAAQTKRSGSLFQRFAFCAYLCCLRRLFRAEDHEFALRTGENPILRALLPVVAQIDRRHARTSGNDNRGHEHDHDSQSGIFVTQRDTHQNLTLAPTVPTLMSLTFGSQSRLSEKLRYWA